MSMLTEVEHDRFLADHYDLKFAAYLWFEANPTAESAEPWGDTPSEKLKSLNWKHWCEDASRCYRFCRLCGFPMPPAEDTHPDERCPVCAELEGVLFRRPFWTDLKEGYTREDRSRMGLE